MKSNLKEIPKEIIVDSIIRLIPDIKKEKIEINVSIGTIRNFYNNRMILYLNKDNRLLNAYIEELEKEDLIIILRYLENLFKCKEIFQKNIKYGEVFDTRYKTWKKIPYNDKEVKEKIKEYLSKKKNVAVLNYKHSPHIREIGNYIKKRTLELEKKFLKTIDVCYDINLNRFLIIVDKFEETYYGINVIHLIDDIDYKYNMKCYGIPRKDFVRKINDKTQKFLMF